MFVQSDPLASQSRYRASQLTCYHEQRSIYAFRPWLMMGKLWVYRIARFWLSTNDFDVREVDEVIARTQDAHPIIRD